MASDASEDSQPSNSRPDDQTRVLSARAGRPGAFDELFRRWSDRCYDVALGVVHRPEIAADVAHEAFLVAWQRLNELSDPRAFGGWVLRAARYRALRRVASELSALDGSVGVRLDSSFGLRFDHLDLDRPRSELGSSDPDSSDPPEADSIDDQRQLIWTAAATLGQQNISLLDLRVRHGLPVAEIADELGIELVEAEELLRRLNSAMTQAIGAAAIGTPAAEHPERQFATLPIAIPSAAMRARMTIALLASGVPLIPPIPTIPKPSTDHRFSLPTPGRRTPAQQDSSRRWPVRPIVAIIAAAALIATGVIALGRFGLHPQQTAAHPVVPPSRATTTTPKAAPTTAPTTAADLAPTTGQPTRTKGTATRRPTKAPATTKAAPVIPVGPVIKLRLTNTRHANATCATGWIWDIRWFVARADAAALILPGGTVLIPATNGTMQTCLAPGEKATLLATGGGKTASTSVVAT